MDSDPNTIVKKRLHVAGLTPAVSASDLTQRLGTFGTVIAVDGVAAVDGLVRPRPVTYVTLEAKNSQLAGCTRHPLTQFLSEPRATGMNLLSGTTWKGVKFRIGEAKPDFRERYGSSYLYGPLQTNCFLLSHIGSNVRMRHLRTTGQPKSVVPRGGVQGVHASDMSLVTPENVSSRSGWHITPMGRIVYPIRMRPEKPLPLTSAVASNTTGNNPQRKKRKREKS